MVLLDKVSPPSFKSWLPSFVVRQTQRKRIAAFSLLGTLRCSAKDPHVNILNVNLSLLISRINVCTSTVEKH